MKKKILIINKSQFGYHTDTFYYCKYLLKNYDVTYLCFDELNKKQNLDGVKVIYVNWYGSFLKKGFNFFNAIFKEINKSGYDLIFVVNFSFCFLIKCFCNHHEFILDLRTGSVNSSYLLRKIEDLLTKINLFIFNKKTIISESLANQFNVNKFTELPLGSEIISSSNKNFDSLKLLYVGTFSNRRIHQTIKALKIFINSNLDTPVIYTIIGFGNSEDVQEIKNEINFNNLNHVVNFVGRVPLDGLKTYFDNHNVGVTYVPQTQYFDCQPSTKIFEYSLSGLINIATNTTENRRYINKFNGLICEDNPTSLAKSLEVLSSSLNKYNSNHIRSNFLNFTWKKIVTDVLQNKIIDIIKK